MNAISKFTLKSIAAGALAFAAIASAQAQSTMATPAATGLYVGGSIGSTAITDLSSKIGYGGYVGFKINENFAVEGAAHSLGKFNVAGTDVSASAYNVSVIGSVPVDPKISIFGRLGYGSVTATAGGTTDSTNNAVFGAGAKYQLNQNLAVRAEYTRLASDTGTFGIGLQYGF